LGSARDQMLDPAELHQSKRTVSNLSRIATGIAGMYSCTHLAHL
jgi:hypothetical protein